MLTSRSIRKRYVRLRRWYRQKQRKKDHGAQIQEVFAAIGEAVILFDSNLIITQISATAKRWLDYSDTAVGVLLWNVCRNEEICSAVQSFVASVEAAPLDGADQHSLILDSVTMVGRESRNVRVKVVPLRTQPTQTVYMMYLFDLTDLDYSQELRKDFFANASHELKTPLSAVKGYAELMSELDCVAKDQTARNFAAIILRNADLLTKIIDDLMTISRLEAGLTKLSLESYDLSKAVDRIFEMLAPKAKQARVTLTKEVPPRLSPIYADYQRFDSVIQNIVDNAIKYNVPGGSVKVTIAEDKDLHVLTVEDSGMGIPEVAKKRVFERFFRVDPAHSRLGGGTGLGLAIVKHIVRAHGGWISLDSEVDVGTKIEVVIPKRRSSNR